MAAGRAQVVSLLRPDRGGIMWRSSKKDVAGESGLLYRSL